MTGHTAPELAELLQNAYSTLLRIKQVISTLADETPDGFIAWGFAEGDAANARDALRQAPSLPAVSPTTASADEAISPARIPELVIELRHTLISAASKATDPDDRHSCLSAALFLSRLHEAVR